MKRASFTGEERRKQHQEASEELDARVAHFEEALRNKMPKEIEKSAMAQACLGTHMARKWM